jgi:hypothetical protein
MDQTEEIIAWDTSTSPLPRVGNDLTKQGIKTHDFSYDGTRWSGGNHVISASALPEGKKQVTSRHPKECPSNCHGLTETEITVRSCGKSGKRQVATSEPCESFRLRGSPAS